MVKTSHSIVRPSFHGRHGRVYSGVGATLLCHRGLVSPRRAFHFLTLSGILRSAAFHVSHHQPSAALYNAGHTGCRRTALGNHDMLSLLGGTKWKVPLGDRADEVAIELATSRKDVKVEVNRRDS